MFFGQYHNKIDDKNRLAIPTKFRSLLAGGGFVTKGLDGCLFIYTKDEWLKLVEQLRTLPVTMANARKMNRYFFANAADFELDKQGRLVLPSFLREFAGIDADVVVTGAMDHIEVWSQTAWEAEAKRVEVESVDVAEQLFNQSSYTA